LSPNDTYPQHVVTAVIVAHDGAAWLPHVLGALLGQTRPVQRVVAVDTGSRDRSGAVLAGQLGQAVVFGMDRGTGYAAAVARALQHRAASTPVPGSPGVADGERVEWIWLLHDDSEPAPDALEQLLRGATEIRAAAVLGPKVMDWADRDVILEAGITIDSAGRRITGIEPRESDQGQHDGDRDSLAVGSAGMLVRRDVWDEVGGFDTGMMLFRDDVDFCWRVHAAGYRVRVVTGAVAYHVEASARHRRIVSVSRRPHRLDRRNALLTLMANLPAVPMLASLAGNVAVSALRVMFFLAAKRLAAALDELAACYSVLGHPLRLRAARRRRSRGRRGAYARLRADLPPGHSARRIAEFAANAMSRSTQLDTAGSHHASADPAEDDSMLVDDGLVQRVLTNPGVLLFIGLTVVTLVAERSLLGARILGGGALVPAAGGAGGLWHEYLQGFHPTGIGSATSAPAYLAVIAALATILGGKPWLAVDTILLGCVPLAGITAYLATRRITRFAPARVWAAAAYALLPVATGSIAAGRIGTAAVFVLLPLIALMAARIFTEPPRRARRAAWATGLGIAVAAAFVPLVWVIALIAAGLAALTLGSARRRQAVNLAIAVLVPPVLLMPWTVQVATHPALLLLEAGVQATGLASPDLPARALMLLSPGGPGLPPYGVTVGLVVAALAALLLSRRRALITAGWGVALVGLLIAIGVSRVTVTPPAGGPSVPAWPGVALAVVAVGLLLAAATAGDAIPRLLTPGPAGDRGVRSVRGAGVILIALVACSAPALAAASWVISGIRGPIAEVRGSLVPELVSVSSDNGLRLRTLVLRVEPGQVSYAVLRGSGASLGYPDLTPDPAAQHALGRAVATLVAPDGGEAADQGQALAQFDIGFVLMPGPVNSGLARLLDGVTGLRPVSATSSFDLWRLVDFPARVRVVEAGGKIVPLPSGAISVSGAAVPTAGGILELAEPGGGWHATLNGHPLTAVRSPAGSWAQAFRLPAGGGLLSIGYDDTGHTAALLLELVAFAAVAMLALPGARPATVSPAATSSGDDAAQAEPSQPAAPRPPGHRGRGGARARGRARGRSGRSGRPGRSGGSGRPGRSGRSGDRPEGDRDAVPRSRRPRRAVPWAKASRDAGGQDAAALDAAAGSAAALDAVALDAAAGSAAAGSAAAGRAAAGARAVGDGGASGAAWDAAPDGGAWSPAGDASARDGAPWGAAAWDAAPDGGAWSPAGDASARDGARLGAAAWDTAARDAAAPDAAAHDTAARDMAARDAAAATRGEQPAGWARGGGPARPADSWQASPHPAWHVGEAAARPGSQLPERQPIPPLPASRTAPPAPGMQPWAPGMQPPASLGDPDLPGWPLGGGPLDSPSSAGGPPDPARPGGDWLDPPQPGGERLDPPPSGSGSGPVWAPAQTGDEVSRWPMPGEDPLDDQW